MLKTIMSQVSRKKRGKITFWLPEASQCSNATRRLLRASAEVCLALKTLSGLENAVSGTYNVRHTAFWLVPAGCR